MGVGCSNLSLSLSLSLSASAFPPLKAATTSRPSRYTNPFPFSPLNSTSVQYHYCPCTSFTMSLAPSSIPSQLAAWKPGGSDEVLSDEFLEKVVSDALVWSALHGLVVGDRSNSRSGKVPGVGMVHAPFALTPTPLPMSYWRQACELAPLFNELVDRVSLDADFLQNSLSRTKKVDEFTGRLLEIHLQMLSLDKKEEIRLGLHRSDYMVDSETDMLYQIELNTISSSFPGLGSLVADLHRNVLGHYGQDLGLDSRNVPENPAVSQFAKALANAWSEYNASSAVVMVVVQGEERNMYDQYWLSTVLKDKHGVASIRKTLAEIDAQGHVLPDGTLVVGGHSVSVVYFRAGYTPNDYPSETEWRARLLIESSSAVKCPSIAYHLVGTKKIQQELAKPDILERFVENKDHVAALRKCFAGLWSLDNDEIVRTAMDKPELFVLKPQREGGGNNIYGTDVREMLIKLRNEGNDGLAAYILMQRIFPKDSLSYLIRDGISHTEKTISELGIYGAYLRNKDKVIINEQSGYLMRTKVSSSNEGGVAAGFAVLDSVYLT
ncbi:Glutathione synthetase [Rhynchospora pubera]|uniref:Glutathione synthetase n=1 Tax=Rhynchospora pubera TaxID=906938 RepID=A0AAV8GAG7_9POAL|nr:Glutathione synthetase [Rhynchospora pubera]